MYHYQPYTFNQKVAFVEHFHHPGPMCLKAKIFDAFTSIKNIFPQIRKIFQVTREGASISSDHSWINPIGLHCGSS